MLAHLARQVRQNLVPFANLHLEGSIAHAFNYGSINWDHIFSWNTSPPSTCAGVNPTASFFDTSNHLCAGAKKQQYQRHALLT
jgi:hypothetical protein